MYNKSNMGFFNFIETFFFISLGITFVLILLLVYHFKQRVCTLEQKGNTMFEIVNGVVKELTNIKKLVIQQNMGASMMSNLGSMNVFSKANPEQMMVNDELQPLHSYKNTNQYNNEYEESDSESEYSESESDEDSETEKKYENNSELDESSVYNDEKDVHYEYSHEETKHEDMNESEILDTDVFANDILPIASNNQTNDIKIINYDNEIVEDELESNNEDTIIEDLNDILSEQSVDAELEEPDKIYEEENTSCDIQEDIQHVVIKLDEQIIESDNVIETPVPVLKDKEDSYKRLTLNQLKATVIAKGITTDTTKLKKNELIKLLANFEEVSKE